MKLDILSILYLLIILGFIITGIKKGLFKSLVSIIKDVLSFVLSIFLAKPLAIVFTNGIIGNKITSKLVNVFTQKGGIFSIEITSNNANEILNMTVSNLHLPDSLNTFLINQLNKLFDLSQNSGMTLAEAFAPTLTHYILLVVSFILIFIIVRLACSLLNAFFKVLEQMPLIKIVNKLFGGALGFITGVLFVYLICFGLTFVISLDNEISRLLVKSMCLNNETFTLSKFMYNENILLKIIAYISNLFVK